MKFSNDLALDAELDFYAASDYMVVCSQIPTTYLEANVTFMLAKVPMSGSDFTKADDVSGRKLTVAAKNGVSITNSGSSTHVALIKSGDSSLRLATICNAQSLTVGNTVNFPEWKFNSTDPV